jgi:hypothetical protein
MFHWLQKSKQSENHRAQEKHMLCNLFEAVNDDALPQIEPEEERDMMQLQYSMCRGRMAGQEHGVENC